MDLGPYYDLLTVRQLLQVGVRHSPDGHSARLTVAGELDDVTTSLLTDAVDDVLRAGPAVVGLDLAAVSFIGSTGIRCLVDCRERVRAAGCAFELLVPSREVLRVLRITGLLTTFGLPR
jgi:anti-sigma B factor antagonist